MVKFVSSLWKQHFLLNFEEWAQSVDLNSDGLKYGVSFWRTWDFVCYRDLIIRIVMKREIKSSIIISEVGLYSFVDEFLFISLI